MKLNVFVSNLIRTAQLLPLTSFSVLERNPIIDQVIDGSISSMSENRCRTFPLV